SVTPNQGPSPLLVTTTNNSSGNGISYLWNLGNGTSSSALNPTTTYNVPGTYSIVLLVTDAAGCTDTTIRTIIVDGLPIDIPNGFTPNGDGFNDYFVIVGLHQYPENKITIFNRWGDPVFSASPYLNNWDGSTSNEKLRISGDKVVDGTYFFILELGAGLEPISGFVELKTR
ncbi:MAG TPA: gliding motility-associated C-terminal domain-containing protein, partial [Flavobacteriales bacterium]|nr:gliding motility-associated C-terminal domain-containing protein [Flavobacteriales bacterium]